MEDRMNRSFLVHPLCYVLSWSFAAGYNIPEFLLCSDINKQFFPVRFVGYSLMFRFSSMLQNRPGDNAVFSTITPCENNNEHTSVTHNHHHTTPRSVWWCIFAQKQCHIVTLILIISSLVILACWEGYPYTMKSWVYDNTWIQIEALLLLYDSKPVITETVRL